MRRNYTTIPYNLMINEKKILHLTVLETDITNSLVLTKEILGEMNESIGKMKLVLMSLWMSSNFINH